MSCPIRSTTCSGRRDVEKADDTARQLAEEYARLDRALDAQAAAQRRVDRCRERIRQLRNGAAPAEAMAPDGDREIAAMMQATISVTQAAQRWGVSHDTIQRLCALHGCGVKIGHRWRVDPAKLREKLRAS
jgi:hypothetical protein